MISKELKMKYYKYLHLLQKKVSINISYFFIDFFYK